MAILQAGILISFSPFPLTLWYANPMALSDAGYNLWLPMAFTSELIWTLLPSQGLFQKGSCSFDVYSMLFLVI